MSQFTNLSNPQLTAQEIRAGLSLRSLSQEEWPSDWAVIEEYCDLIRRDVNKHDPDLAMAAIEGLCGVFRHRHTHVYTSAAEALGEFKHAEARGVLLHALTRVTDERALSMIFAALRKHAKHVSTLQKGQHNRMRLALLRAFAQFFDRDERLNHHKSDLINTLHELGNHTSPTIICAGFTASAVLTGAQIDVAITPLAENNPPNIEEMPWLSDEDRSKPVGMQIESKFTFLEPVPHADVAEVSQLQIASSAWAPSKRLHRAISSAFGPLPKQARDDDPHFARAEAKVVGPCYAAFETSLGFPGLACLHVILVSSDNMVVEAQRASQANTYHPGAWTPGFEEQFTGKDFCFIEPSLTTLGIEVGQQGNDHPTAIRSTKPIHPIRACMLRGLDEELGLKIAAEDLEIGQAAFGVEWPIMNRCLLVAVRVQRTGEQILEQARQRALAQKRGERELELPRLTSLDSLRNHVRYHESGFWHDSRRDLFHPTSAARIGLLLLYPFNDFSKSGP